MRYKSLWALRSYARSLFTILILSFVVMALNGFLEMRAMWETQEVFQPLFLELQSAPTVASDSPEAVGRRIGAKAGEKHGAELGRQVGEQVGRQVQGELAPDAPGRGEAVGGPVGEKAGAKLGPGMGEDIGREVALDLEKMQKGKGGAGQSGSIWKRLAASFGVKIKPVAVAERPKTRDEVLAQMVRSAGILLAYFLAAAAATAASFYLGELVSQRLLVALRQAVFGHLQALSLGFFERRRTGELISRINNDTAVLQRILGPNLGRLVVAPFAVLFSVGAMLAISVRLTLLTAAMIPIVLLASSLMGRKVREYARVVQERFADLTAIIDETFQGFRVVKIFGMESLSAQRFDGANVSVMRYEMRANRLRAVNIVFVGGLTGAAICGALLVGAQEVARGQANTAQLMTFILLMQTAASRLSYLARANLMLQQAEASAARTLDVLSEKADLTEAENPVSLDTVQGAIRFSNVTFAYDDEPVIRSMDLDVAPGEVIALVGPSGAGKTTVANLVARLYDVNEGSVSIDNVDVREMSFDCLKGNMGIVPQETILFGASVRENIGYGKPAAGEDEVVAAAKAANAHGFVQGLPEGYDTQVGERGAKLSGGQKQRIAIARALLRDPAILILDEATSSLDNESEAAIHRALQTLIKGRTTIIIAHRLSTIQNADRIVVLDRGRIVEQGTHEQLLQRGGMYRQLYESGTLGGEDQSQAAGDEDRPADTPDADAKTREV